MQRFALCLILVLSVPDGAALADTQASITVAAKPATANMKPLPEGRRVVRLPALQFFLAVRTDCGADMSATSVVVSVADTRRTLDSQRLAAEPEPSVELFVPGPQLSPLAIDGFCRDGDNDDPSESELFVNDVVTAHVSLRCSGDNTQAIGYVSKPLAIKLVCERDQAPSESSTAR